MEITDRVQIVPFGYETVRVLEPVYQFKADTVVLIRRNAEDDYEAQFQRDVVDELRENDRIELETRECDFFDFDSALRTITDAIQSHTGNDVYVNVAAGSKITAIAAIIACQTQDATPFYVSPEFRSEEGELEPPDEPLVENIGDIDTIPVFDLDQPSPQQLEILSHLYENEGATKKELIRFAESRELEFIAESETQSDEGRYRLLETHVISPLTAESYINVEKVGRTKHVYLADRGREALRMFRPDYIDPL